MGQATTATTSGPSPTPQPPPPRSPMSIKNKKPVGRRRDDGGGEEEEGDRRSTRSSISEEEKEAAAAASGGLCVNLRSWTRRQKVMIATIALAEMAGFAGLSVIAPLFPSLAESKGMSTRNVGLVFSSFALSGFIGAPIAGMMVPKIGVKIMLVAGIVISGASGICFGLIEDVNDEAWFCFGAFAFRILQGLSYSFYITGAFAVVTTIFQSQMGLVLSILEIVIGIGLSVGPPIGSGLFAVGGYKLPFACLGVLMFISAVPLMIVLPSAKEFLKSKEHQDQELDADVKRKPMRKLFVSYEPMLVLVTIVVTSISFIYYHPILQPFLEQKYGTKETEAGFVFLASLGSYCLTTPISGILSDMYPHRKYSQIMTGLVFAAVGGLVVGPAPFLLSVLPQKKSTTIAGLVLAGIGFSLAVVPTFQGFTDVTIAAGFPADIRTFGMTSALWNSAWSLGECIGPAVASGVSDLLDDYVLSFVTSSGITIAMVVVLLLHVLCYKRRRPASAAAAAGNPPVAAGDVDIITSIPSANINDQKEEKNNQPVGMDAAMMVAGHVDETKTGASVLVVMTRKNRNNNEAPTRRRDAAAAEEEEEEEETDDESFADAQLDHATSSSAGHKQHV
ncbi:unnamed protein product [Notodromas monacha]|uniref:Major facilitator superfamily (MFS) profile domain-containing protein n=1 Tax=Notodromas monacha TaxID=399045 RepID=A0A7R9BKV4_9CRUS|nr:unnamed protein product [Notodromas monacha]CAG0916254.1 unnamed protein product [Notodromas monacha]